MINYYNLSTQEILLNLKEYFQTNSIITIQSNNCDIKLWTDISQILLCTITNINSNGKKCIISLKKVNAMNSFHKQKNIEEKYGSESSFMKIDKFNQASFIYYFQHALDYIQIDKRENILDIGIHKGDEFEFIRKTSGTFNNMTFVGIDYCQSALNYAKKRFNMFPNIHLYNADINKMDELNLGVFDTLISIGTLQSSSLNLKPLFMSLVQQYLAKQSAIILGFPNCRWYDEHMFYGAKTKNYSFSELSLLYNDVIFCKKYLQQKKYKVIITGKEYIFLSAIRLK